MQQHASTSKVKNIRTQTAHIITRPQNRKNKFGLKISEEKER